MKKKAEEKVVNYILTEIENGHLLPNMKLIEEDIASLLTVSRSPVRAAFKKLEKKGVIQLVPNKGAYITHLKRSNKDFINRLQLFELLMNQYLFELEKWQVNIPVMPRSNDSGFSDDFKVIMELDELLFFQKNKYAKQILIQTHASLIQENYQYLPMNPTEIIRKLTQLNQLIRDLVSKKKYADARKQVRLIVNALTLEIIDHQEIEADKYLDD